MKKVNLVVLFVLIVTALNAQTADSTSAKNELSFNVSGMYRFLWWGQQPYPILVNYQRNIGKLGIRIGANTSTGQLDNTINDTIPVTTNYQTLIGRFGLNYLILNDNKTQIRAGADFIYTQRDSSYTYDDLYSYYTSFNDYSKHVTGYGFMAGLKINYRLNRLLSIGTETNFMYMQYAGEQVTIYKYYDQWYGYQEMKTKRRINENQTVIYLPFYLHLNIHF